MNYKQTHAVEFALMEQIKDEWSWLYPSKCWINGITRPHPLLNVDEHRSIIIHFFRTTKHLDSDFYLNPFLTPEYKSKKNKVIK